jgi:hypothetical protein
MREISDSNDITQIPNKIEDLTNILCESQPATKAEKKTILTNDDDKNIYSNSDEFIGVFFYSCQLKKCNFFL